MDRLVSLKLGDDIWFPARGFRRLIRPPSQLITRCTLGFPFFMLCARDLNTGESPAWFPLTAHCRVHSSKPRSLGQPSHFAI